MFTSDARQLRCYTQQSSGKWLPKFFIEPGTALNYFQKFDDSGLFTMACDDRFLNFFYVPDLGPAPKWAKDLDAQVQDIDVQQAAGEYADYKFVTREELEALGLSQLAGTSRVITYMHGFYVPKELYNKGIV